MFRVMISHVCIAPIVVQIGSSGMRTSQLQWWSMARDWRDLVRFNNLNLILLPRLSAAPGPGTAIVDHYYGNAVTYCCTAACCASLGIDRQMYGFSR